MNKTIVLVAALAAVGACKKKNDDATKTAPAPTTPAPTPGSATAPEPTAKPVEAPKPVAGDDIVKRFDECWGFWNDSKWDDFKGCFTEDATSEEPPFAGPFNGRDAVVDAAKMLKTGLPDAKGELALVLVNGHTAVTVALVTGTNSAAMKTPMGEMPATNKKVGFMMSQVVELDDFGHAKKLTGFSDAGTMLGQLNPMKDHPVRPAMDKLPMARESVVAKDDDKEKANLATDKSFVEAFNKHDPKAFAAILADDATWFEAAESKDHNKKDVVPMTQAFWKGFSDIKITPASQWAAGDYVVTQGTIAGKNDGDIPMMKMKKTNKDVSIPFVQIDKVADGKVKGVWIFYQGMAMAQQLGMMPPPGAAGSAAGAGSAAPKTK
jgi:ketosteroid isomerase-like protein